MADNLATFLAVTGCEDEASAKFFLESANNDVEQAINTYMEQGGAARVGEGTTGPQDAEDDAAPAANVSVGMAGATPGGAEEQRWYTGGPAGGSGQEVIAPGQGGDKNNKAFEALREAVEPHARQGTSEDLAEESNVFTGAARTLDGQIRNAPMKKKKMLIKFYQNAVFTVDDGPPRSVEDPANQAFLEAIKERRVPDELRDEFQDGLDLSIMPMPEDYDPASAPKPKFVGKSNKLGSGEASTSATAASTKPVEAWSGPDDSKPITSIQIRMPDGQRLVGRFNPTQLIQEIRSFVAAARPGQPVPPVMMTGFPSKPIEDESISIEAGGLISAVVIFK